MSVSENKHNHYLHIAIIILIAINIIINIISMKSAENIEIMKVWWAENYEKLKVIMQSDSYKEQYAQNLELMLQQIQWGSEEFLPSEEEQQPEIESASWVEINTADTTTNTPDNATFDVNENQE